MEITHLEERRQLAKERELIPATGNRRPGREGWEIWHLPQGLGEEVGRGWRDGEMEAEPSEVFHAPLWI